MQVHLLSQEFLLGFNRINLSVIAGGYADLDKNWKNDAIRHPFTRMYFVESGEGYVHANGKTHRLQEGYVYIIPSGLRFSFACPHKMQQLFLHLQVLQKDHDLFQHCREFFAFPVEEATVTTIKTLLTSQSPTAPIALKPLVWQMLLPVFETVLANERNGRKMTAPMQEVLGYIADNLSAQLTTERIATQFHVSRSKLQRDFKANVGATPKEYIHTQLLIKAEHLLFHTTCSIKEISDQLGFCDQFYFSKCFTARYGLPPLRYRKNHRTAQKQRIPGASFQREVDLPLGQDGGISGRGGNLPPV